MFTTIRAIMRPRRLRSSMNRVAIMPPVGIDDPRWSRGRRRVDRRLRGRRRRAPAAGSSVIPVPQSARDLQEPRFERGLDLLEAVHGDPAFDQDAVDLGDDVAGRCPPAG